jgi:hypothetical protein
VKRPQGVSIEVVSIRERPKEKWSQKAKKASTLFPSNVVQPSSTTLLKSSTGISLEYTTV